MDLDLRKLRYFAAVAESLHFGRAAEQLYIAQPVLSRQIRALEREIGCDLLVRTTRNVALTAAGEQLHAESRGLLAAVDSALRRVHERDRGVQRLVVAFTPSLHVSEAIRAFTATRPEVEVELLPARWWEQDAPLRDGRADVGYLCRPFDDAGLRTVPIGTLSKVACLPSGHRLAGRTSLLTADLEDEAVLDAQTRRTTSLEEKFELVAMGRGIAVVPSTVAESYSRPDLAYLPVTDAPPVQTCLVAAEERCEPRVLEFIEIATEVLRTANGGS